MCVRVCVCVYVHACVCNWARAVSGETLGKQAASKRTDVKVTLTLNGSWWMRNCFHIPRSIAMLQTTTTRDYADGEYASAGIIKSTLLTWKPVLLHRLRIFGKKNFEWQKKNSLVHWRHLPSQAQRGQMLTWGHKVSLDMERLLLMTVFKGFRKKVSISKVFPAPDLNPSLSTNPL